MTDLKYVYYWETITIISMLVKMNLFLYEDMCDGDHSFK